MFADRNPTILFRYQNRSGRGWSCSHATLLHHVSTTDCSLPCRLMSWDRPLCRAGGRRYQGDHDGLPRIAASNPSRIVQYNVPFRNTDNNGLRYYKFHMLSSKILCINNSRRYVRILLCKQQFVLVCVRVFVYNLYSIVCNDTYIRTYVCV